MLHFYFPQTKMDATHDYFRKSGQIPAFGDWDYANELPITQYFECARQAGLIRYSSSSGDSDQHARPDLYTLEHCPQKPSRTTITATQTQTQPRKTRGREKRCPHVKEQKIKQQSKVCDVTEPPRKPSSHQTHHHQPNDAVPPRRPARLPKPVDEDLYKIPPELLHASKRKKRLGIFSRCLVPTCTS